MPESPDRQLIVLVEDLLAVRHVVARELRDAGYDVLTAPDGTSAVTLIEGLRAPPDLVIIDLRLPTMQGDQLGTWLTLRYLRLPIVFISGFPTVAEHLPGPLLRKPFTAEELCAVVQEELAKASVG